VAERENGWTENSEAVSQRRSLSANGFFVGREFNPRTYQSAPLQDQVFIARGDGDAVKQALSITEPRPAAMRNKTLSFQ
jgi:hypothetical protein